MPPSPVAVAEIAWADFLPRFDWRQGEHVSLIGPTGTGKTTLGIQLLPLRRYVAAIGTKPKDPTFDSLERDAGFRLVDPRRRGALPHLPDRGVPPRVLVWPRSRTLDRAAKRDQRRIIHDALNRAYSAGGWTLFADELSYLSRTLSLAPELVDIWQQGRSNSVSLIGCTQRPRWVPLDCYSAATHLFLWRTNDSQDIARLSGLNGADTRAVRAIVPDLGRHDVLYVNTRTGELCVTVAPKL